jgi:hypothetical protein
MTLSSSTMAGPSRLWSTRRGKILDPAGSLLEPLQPRKQRPFAGRRAAPAAGAASFRAQRTGVRLRMSGALVNGRQQQASAEAAKRSSLPSRAMARGDDTGGMGGGALPSSYATRKNGIAHAVPTARGSLLGAAVRHASRRFRDQDPQSRTRGEVLGVEVAVGHAVAQHVVARRNARGWSDVSRRSGRFPGQRPRTTGDRLPRAPPWSAPTTYRWSMSSVGRDAAPQRLD